MTAYFDNHFTLSSIETPLGELTLGATNKGISHLAFPSDPLHLRHLTLLHDPNDDTAENRNKRLNMLQDAHLQLSQYFGKERHGFDIPLDLGSIDGFKLDVLNQIAVIPYGSHLTYSELAVVAGNPPAIRVAGSVCATNPIPIFIPCHRVIKSGGMTGNYSGGIKVKEFLLELEQ